MSLRSHYVHTCCTRTLLHPQQAGIWQAFTVARRILSKRVDLRDAFASTWKALVADEWIGFGVPFRGFLGSSLSSQQNGWTRPLCVTGCDGTKLHFFQGITKQWKHSLRNLLRGMVWKTDKAFLKRQDMDGAGIVAYESTVPLLRRSEKPPRRCFSAKVPCLSLFEKTDLRNILTGVVRTQERLHKASSHESPVCACCSTNSIESLEHLFWKCPTWNEVRRPFLDKYGGFSITCLTVFVTAVCCPNKLRTISLQTIVPCSFASTSRARWCLF